MANHRRTPAKKWKSHRKWFHNVKAVWGDAILALPRQPYQRLAGGPKSLNTANLPRKLMAAKNFLRPPLIGAAL